MAILAIPGIEPDFFMSVHQCYDCLSDPPDCTDEIKRTCPFYHIRNDPKDQENGTC